MQKAHFTLFSFANKAILEYGTWLKYEAKKEIRGELKMYLNRALVNAENFEKELHKYLGPEMAKEEDNMNIAVLEHVQRIYELTTEEKESFFDHMEKWEFKPKEEDERLDA